MEEEMDSNIWSNYIIKYVSDNSLFEFYSDFLSLFENEWSKYTSGYSFSNLCQIEKGNRLRPMLVYWGYLLNKNNDELFNSSENELHSIMKPCLMIESIHKMSLLIDDWIDGDIARHGISTFHTQYDPYTTIILAINLLLKGYLNLGLYLDNSNNKTKNKSLILAIQIAYDMTNGALKELSLNSANMKVSKVKEIISLETSSIIKNGLIIGYTLNKNTNDTIAELLEEIGDCCGYIFQLLNDLEPFGNANGLINHKGSLTTDVLKERKNIVVAYILAWANQKERFTLLCQNDPKMMLSYASELIKKYDIVKHMMTEISNLQDKIKNRISIIEKETSHCNWCKHFESFIDITISASKKRALS